MIVFSIYHGLYSSCQLSLIYIHVLIYSLGRRQYLSLGVALSTFEWFQVKQYNRSTKLHAATTYVMYRILAEPPQGRVCAKVFALAP